MNIYIYMVILTLKNNHTVLFTIRFVPCLSIFDYKIYSMKTCILLYCVVGTEFCPYFDKFCPCFDHFCTFNHTFIRASLRGYETFLHTPNQINPGLRLSHPPVTKTHNRKPGFLRWLGRPSADLLH